VAQYLQVLGGVTASEQREQLNQAAQREVGELRQHPGRPPRSAAEAPPYRAVILTNWQLTDHIRLYAPYTLTRTPSVVMDLPGAGYMQSELSSAAVEFDISVSGGGTVQAVPRERPLGWLTRWNWEASAFAEVVGDVLDNPSEASRRAEAAHDAFIELRRSEDRDFFTILSRVTAQAPQPLLGPE
jgi:hypothetical protein